LILRIEEEAFQGLVFILALRQREPLFGKKEAFVVMRLLFNPKGNGTEKSY
jgi:hypothetical protein